jgi:sn-glycerol 3-phosphate transport system ATP-binding protein
MSRIETHNLVKQWGPVRAVDDVSFHVADASLTVLLGPSGCGKSTILRMIAGLEKVTSGRITIGGQDVTRLDAAKRGVSMVFQSYALFPHLNVRENILFGLKVRRVSLAEREGRLAEVAKMVGLDELLDRKPAQLSGGQRQRVALARSIVSQQPVCLMDEPLSNLDAKLRNEMRDEIRGLQQKLGLTMIYVTHDQTEAMTMADQVVLLQDGRIVQVGPPHELYEYPATDFSARFIGSPPMNLLRIDLIEDREALLAAGGDPPFSEVSRGWSLGIRPEEINLSERGLPVRVGAVDFLGAETVIRLFHGDQPIFARTNGRAKIAPGDRLKISWPRVAIHLFDENGIRREGSDPA